MAVVYCVVCIFVPAVQTKPNIESSSRYLENDGFWDGAGPGSALVGKVEKDILVPDRVELALVTHLTGQQKPNSADRKRCRAVP